jgi:hypothetical protein
MKRRQQNEEKGPMGVKKIKNVDIPDIISENPIDIDKLKAMKKIHMDADFRIMFGIKDGIPMEVQLGGGGEWTPAVVDKAETGRTYRFHDSDWGSNKSESEYKKDGGVRCDFCDVPVVTIIKDGEAPRRREICFINRCLIYDIDEEEIINWKHFDEPWVGDVGKRVWSDVVEFDFTTVEELRKHIESFVPRMMCNVLEKNAKFFNQLPYDVQMTMTAEVLYIKNSMVDKIVNFFIEKKVLAPGTQIVLDPQSMQSICDQVLKEIYEKSH